MNSIVYRINVFRKNLNKSMADFSKNDLGRSVNYFAGLLGKKDPSIHLEDILFLYNQHPNLNRNWIERGEGEMILTQNDIQSSRVEEGSSEYNAAMKLEDVSFNDFFEEKIRSIVQEELKKKGL